MLSVLCWCWGRVGGGLSGRARGAGGAVVAGAVAGVVVPGSVCVSRGRSGGARGFAAVAFVLVVGAWAAGMVVAGAGGGVRVSGGVVARHAAGTRLPWGAEGPVSRVLGRDDRAYRAVASGSGFVARNRGQGLWASFGLRGVVVRSGAAWLGIRLAGYGRVGRLRAVGAVRPSADGNRVVYGRAGVNEWYVNGPLGVEQGFTLPARPVGGGALVLSLGVSGNVRARLSGDRVVFSRAGASLAYDGLVVTDASGRRLPARMRLNGGRMSLVIDDRGASYPVRIDPFVQQAKLTASDGSADADLGASVAISADGSTIVAGAPNLRFLSPGPGAVYVFVKPSGGWANATESAKLTASDSADTAAGDRLGSSVAISGDGSTIVAGAPRATVGADQDQGAAYEFVEPARGWASEHETAKLTALDGGRSAMFGSSAGVSGDGSTVVVGATGDSNNRGAAYVFVSGTQQTKLTAFPGTSNDFLGTSVSVSSDGSAVVVGAPGATVGTDSGQGAAVVFDRPSVGWAGDPQTAELTASDGAAADSFGDSVAISADGSTIVAGADGATVGTNSGQGAAYLFVRPSTIWTGLLTQTAKLTASDGDSSDDFGRAVSMSSDGTTVAAGADGATWAAMPSRERCTSSHELRQDGCRQRRPRS